MSQLNLNFGKVAVLMGGASAEREVSLMSARVCCKPCVPTALMRMHSILHSGNSLN
jgi:D-alanine-D-alanine ligase-like ATP-grasp enzyme